MYRDNIEWMNEGIHLDLDTWIVPGQIQGQYYWIAKWYKTVTGRYASYNYYTFSYVSVHV